MKLKITFLKTGMLLPFLDYHQFKNFAAMFLFMFYIIYACIAIKYQAIAF